MTRVNLDLSVFAVDWHRRRLWRDGSLFKSKNTSLTQHVLLLKMLYNCISFFKSFFFRQLATPQAVQVCFFLNMTWNYLSVMRYFDVWAVLNFRIRPVPVRSITRLDSSDGWRCRRWWCKQPTSNAEARRTRPSTVRSIEELHSTTILQTAFNSSSSPRRWPLHSLARRIEYNTSWRDVTPLQYFCRAGMWLCLLCRWRSFLGSTPATLSEASRLYHSTSLGETKSCCRVETKYSSSFMIY